MASKDLVKEDLLKHIYQVGLPKQEDDQEQLDEDYLDETIIAAIQTGHSQFIEGLEKFLNDFVQDKNKQNEKLHKLDKFQRKIVHKICDRYNVTRDYVEVKNDSGTVSLSKQSQTQVPQKSALELYEQQMENQDENQDYNQHQQFMQPNIMPQQMNPQLYQQYMQQMQYIQQYQMQMGQQQKFPNQDFINNKMPQQHQIPQTKPQLNPKFNDTEDDFPSL